MATFSNQTKNTSVITNQSTAESQITWDQDTATWDEQQGTWDRPLDAFVNQTKNTSAISNQTKN